MVSTYLHRMLIGIVMYLVYAVVIRSKNYVTDVILLIVGLVVGYMTGKVVQIGPLMSSVNFIYIVDGTLLSLIIFRRYRHTKLFQILIQFGSNTWYELEFVIFSLFIIGYFFSPKGIIGQFAFPLFLLDLLFAPLTNLFFNIQNLLINKSNGSNITNFPNSNNNALPTKNIGKVCPRIRKSKIEVTNIDAMNNFLKQNIIGQDEAVDIVTRQIKTKIVMQEKTKKRETNLGVFMFVGPTGVGKTETAKNMASYLKQFGYQYLFFQMSNFADIYASNTLVGSPKGYIGSQEGGALTRPLMQNPKAVIVFDEMEKAHGSLFKPLMGLIDDGYIQEISTGGYAKVENSIIIFTSNLMQGTIQALSNKVTDPIERVNILRDVLQGKFNDAARIVGESIIKQDLQFVKNDSREGNPFFPPEFLGRITEIVPYKSLTDAALLKLTYAEASKLNVKNKEVINKAFEDYKHVAYKYGVRQYLIQIRPALLNL